MNLRLHWQECDAIPEFLLVIVGAIMLGVGYVFAICHLQGAITAGKNNQLHIKTSLYKFAASNSRIKEQQKIFGQTAHYFFTVINLASLVKNLANLAMFAKADLVFVKPGQEFCKNSLCYFPLQISIVGNWQQIITFIFALAKTEKLYVLYDLVLQPYGDNLQATKLLRLDGQVLVYKLQESAISASATKSNGTPNWQKLFLHRLKLNDLFFLDNAKLRDLYLWDTANFKMLGTIKQDKQIWGIIADPVGNIYHVTAGMQIGVRHYRILKVSEEAIIVEQSAGNIFNSSFSNEF